MSSLSSNRVVHITSGVVVNFELHQYNNKQTPSIDGLNELPFSLSFLRGGFAFSQT